MDFGCPDIAGGRAGRVDGMPIPLPRPLPRPLDGAATGAREGGPALAIRDDVWP